MTKVLLFVALGDFNSPVALIPQTPDARTIRAPTSLGAAKKKKRVRRTEGRTGLIVGACEIASGDSASCDVARHALRH